MIDIESKIISYREDTNDYRLCLTREEITKINQALNQDLNNDDEDWGKEYCKLVDLYAIKCQKVRELEDKFKQIRAEVIDEVMRRAETIQLEQIENLNQTPRKNAKMWARYMSTYLGHIQVACKRMLELKEQNK